MRPINELVNKGVSVLFLELKQGDYAIGNSKLVVENPAWEVTIMLHSTLGIPFKRQKSNGFQILVSQEKRFGRYVFKHCFYRR